MTQMSLFAKAIMEQKYSHVKPDGTRETWDEIARRVAENVMGAVNAPGVLVDAIYQVISERKFIPGGRYLYAAGRPYHQTNNCLCLSVEDSREGWAELLRKSSMALMTGAGIGVEYSKIRPEGDLINKTGGYATGPIALMQMVNEVSRGVMQGGARRSAILAMLSWKHQDIYKYIVLKNWPDHIRELKGKDVNFPATMDGTNISVRLDDEFFKAFHNANHALHSHASSVYWAVIKQSLQTGEPGFTVDVGVDRGETLRNAPVSADTHVLTGDGYARVGEIVNRQVVLWTGKRWAKDVVFRKTMENVPVVEVAMTGGRIIKCEPDHPFLIERYRGGGKKRRLVSVDRIKAKDLQRWDICHVGLPGCDHEFDFNKTAYTFGFVYGDGSFGETSVEVSLCTEEKRKCSDLFDAGLIRSVTDPDSRGYKRVYFDRKNPLFLNCTKDDIAPHIHKQSDEYVASFIAGLFDADGNYMKSRQSIRLASVQFNFLRQISRLLERLGILSTISKGGVSGYGGKDSWLLCVMSSYVPEFCKKIPTIRLRIEASNYQSYRHSTIKVLSVGCLEQREDVYCCNVGVEEHSFMAEGVIISNCGEITSSDPDDICNLGSINMARIETHQEMKKVVELGTAFLLAGTVYSDVPYEEARRVREKNRRLGLGLMGLHEWLVMRGKIYGPDEDLAQYLEIYAGNKAVSDWYADVWRLSRPVKTRSIAPVGTTGIIAETTTGIEPVFCVAYKRRYRKGAESVEYQYVLDPTAKRLVDAGINPEAIEDAYTLASNIERRVAFQVWMQQYVDHGISSTLNLPAWGTEHNNQDKVIEFGNMLMKYLPRLRGITAYPDGSRSGQPLTPVKYHTAEKHIGQVFVETVDVCDLKGGSCGS